MSDENQNPPLVCASCLQPKSSLKNKLSCGLCSCRLCKDCAQFHDPDFFSFMGSPPEELCKNAYCAPCFEAKVAPAKAAHAEMLERAKKIYVFEKKHHIPLIQRSKQQVSVRDCPDREEALLRLGFFAAEQGFNALVESKLVSEKVFVNGYQSLNWSGSAYPAQIRAESLEENRLRAKTEKPMPELIRKKRK